MSTALSWTELRSSRQDLAAILAFRRSSLSASSRRRLLVVVGVVLGMTIMAVLGPAYLGGSFPRPHAGAVLAVFPSMCLGFLALASMTAIASAGGREVIARDQAVAYPVSTTTDHLGALLLAPLNIAWLLQTWALLGVPAYALGPRHALYYELPVVLWIVAATALAQCVGWLAEGLRRGVRGLLVFRGLVTALGGTLVGLIVAGQLSHVLDVSPLTVLLDLVIQGATGRLLPWSVGVVALALVIALAVVVGTLPARWALHRPMREELRLEGGHHRVRPSAGSDLAMMVRIDRSAIWRSVPLRRGLAVLTLMPGAVALAGDLEWRMLTVLPGLVASGGALLFGVNTWCLDGRGALWRDSLPVSPRVSFASRVIVLFEVLLGSAAVTLVLAAVRAGAPTTAELLALVCSTLVVAAQVVSAGMRWSIARPYAVDLRSARATPAPPVVMAGYSARLAVATTVTGLVFSGLAFLGDVRLALVVTVLLLVVSGWRLERSAQRWSDPETRSRVIAVVAS